MVEDGYRDGVVDRYGSGLGCNPSVLDREGSIPSGPTEELNEDDARVVLDLLTRPARTTEAMRNAMRKREHDDYDVMCVGDVRARGETESQRTFNPTVPGANPGEPTKERDCSSSGRAGGS